MTLVVLGCSSGSDGETDTELGAAGTAGVEQQDATGGQNAATTSAAGERSTGGEATGGTGTGGALEAGAAGAQPEQTGGTTAGAAGETGSSTGGTSTGGSPTGGALATGGRNASGGSAPTGGRSTGGTKPSGGASATGGSSSGGSSTGGQGTGGIQPTMPGIWSCDLSVVTVCPTGCSMLGIDPHNCGECGRDITQPGDGDGHHSESVCVDGVPTACGRTDDGGWKVRCGVHCYDLRTANEHCGECGNDCTKREYSGEHSCRNGVCGG